METLPREESDRLAGKRKAPDDALKCRLLDTFEGQDSLRAEWDQAVLRLGGTVYMTYDWTRLWWQFYGENSLLRVFLFFSSDTLVGVVPTYIDGVGWGPLRLRVARLVGSPIPPKVFDPPVDPAKAAAIWQAILQRLLDRDRCDILSFGPMRDRHPPFEVLSEVARSEVALISGVKQVQQDVCTVYELPQDFDAYFNSLDSKERKVRRKKLRELEATSPIRTEVLCEPEAVVSEFEAFAEQHTRQWQAEGRPGHFHAWPGALEYNRALVNQLAQLGRVRFFKLWAGDTVVANQYTYLFGRSLFAELPARISESGWEKFSLGCTSQIKLIEGSIALGIHRLESGLGHYEYKVLTGGVEFPVSTIQIIGRRAFSRVKVLCWSKVARALRILFHKGWYRYLAPKLPARFRTGQSRLVIRMDF